MAMFTRQPKAVPRNCIGELSRLARLCVTPLPPMRCDPITAQGLGDQQLTLLQSNAVPRQPNQFSVPESCAQPDGKAGVEPLLVGPDVLQQLLDLTLAQHLLLDAAVRSDPGARRRTCSDKDTPTLTVMVMGRRVSR